MRSDEAWVAVKDGAARSLPRLTMCSSSERAHQEGVREIIELAMGSGGVVERSQGVAPPISKPDATKAPRAPQTLSARLYVVVGAVP